MKRFLIVAALLLHPQSAGAQETNYKAAWQQRLDRILALNTSVPTDRLTRISRELQIDENLGAFLLFAQAKSGAGVMAAVEEARLDKQVGAPGNAPGSTSLVSKGAVPAILGFAVENGALTQTATGAGVTLRGNLVGWLDLLRNQGFIAAYDDDARLTRQLRRVSYSLTYTNGADSAPAATDRPDPEALKARIEQTTRQLAGYSVRVALWDQRDPRREANRAAVSVLLDEEGVRVLRENNFLDDLLNSDAYDRWRLRTATLLAAIDPALGTAPLEKVLYRQLDEVRQMMLADVPDADARIAAALSALRGFERARVGVFEAMQKRPLIAFEYVRARPAGLPDVSTYRLIAEGEMWGRLDLTANAAVSVQHAGTALVPDAMTLGGVRDIQIAAQAELPLGRRDDCLRDASGIGRPALGFAYLSQRLRETAVVKFAGHDFSVAPGWVHAAQARVTIPVRGSGVRIPFSVSIANRTELIKEKTVKAHLGLTFDLDVLAAGLRR